MRFRILLSIPTWICPVERRSLYGLRGVGVRRSCRLVVMAVREFPFLRFAAFNEVMRVIGAGFGCGVFGVRRGDGVEDSTWKTCGSGRSLIFIFEFISNIEEHFSLFG